MHTTLVPGDLFINSLHNVMFTVISVENQYDAVPVDMNASDANINFNWTLLKCVGVGTIWMISIFNNEEFMQSNEIV